MDSHPESRPVVEPPVKARGGLMGLPTRLALSALALVFACCALLGLLVNYELTASSDAQLRDAAETMGRAIAGDLALAELASPSSSEGVLQQRFQEASGGAANIEGVALVALRKGTPKVMSTAGSVGAPKSMAAKLDGSGTTAAFRTTADGERMQVLVPVGSASSGERAGVLVEVDRSGLSRGIVGSRWNIVLATILGAALLGAALLLLLRRELFRPLFELRQTMTRVRSGEKGVRSAWNRNDELGALAYDFDATVEALELAERELARYVTHDPETGVLNGEAFRDRLASELTRWRRGGLSVALMQIAVRGYDELGVEHGAEAQLSAVRTLADAVGLTIRPTDVLGREGGTLMLAIVGSSVEDLGGIVRRLRSTVSGRVTSGVGDGRVDLGWSLVVPDQQEDEESLMRRSDGAVERSLSSAAERCALGLADGSESWLDERPLVGAQASDEEGPMSVSAVFDLARQLARHRGSEAHYQRIAESAVRGAREAGVSERRQQLVRAAVGLLPLAEVDKDLIRSTTTGDAAAIVLGALGQASPDELPEARALREAILAEDAGRHAA